MATWLNAGLALAELGFDPPLEWVFISPANQVLRKAWESEAWHWPYDRSKPSWLKMLAAERRALLRLRKADAMQALRREGRRRITAAYAPPGEPGTFSFEDETAVRLRGENTPAQDADRERLRGRYRALKARIEATSTEAQLLAIDVRDHGLWAAG